MTESDRVKRQLYMIALDLWLHPPPGVRINLVALSAIIEFAMPEPGDLDLSRLKFPKKLIWP